MFILFYHLHKCAGTSIVQWFKKNGYKLHHPNANGNPLDGKRRLIPFCESNVVDFIKKCKQKKINFIATEWQFPKIDLVKNMLNVTTICVFRDPYDRFISNYRYDYKNKFTRKDNIVDYVGSSGMYTHYNYYTLILSGKPCNNKIEKATEKDLIKALQFMETITHIIIQEIPESFTNVKNKLNMKYKINKINKSNKNVNVSLDRNIFIEQNKFDYIIYKKAIELYYKNNTL